MKKIMEFTHVNKTQFDLSIRSTSEIIQLIFSQVIDYNYKTGKIDQNIDLRLYGANKTNMVMKSRALFDEELKSDCK